jgi:hypothetical protein
MSVGSERWTIETHVTNGENLCELLECFHVTRANIINNVRMTPFLKL